LSAEIVKATRALEELDQYHNNGSKLFSSENPHKILAEAFLCGLLKYLAKYNQSLDYTGWKSFFQMPERSFNRCRWNLPFVRTPGALSSGNGQPSKTVAKDCFEATFINPSALDGTILTDFLQGVKAGIRVIVYVKTSSGRLSTRNPFTNIVNPGAGLVPIDLSSGGINGEIIRVESNTPNCYILNVIDPSVIPAIKLTDALKGGGLDVSGFLSGQEIEIVSMSYSGDTTKHTKVRLDK
jgi:hypothetical protein